jgi:hypothetical protein
MSICGVVRPPHRLGGVAKSRSLFVATPPLILALLDKGSNFEESEGRYHFEKELKPNLGFYLTGQVVAAYNQVRLTSQVSLS